MRDIELGTLEKTDFTSILPQFETRTLVVHARHFTALDMRVSSNMAAQIPNSQFVVLAGSSGYFFVDDYKTNAGIITQFLTEDASKLENRTALPAEVESGLSQRKIAILKMLAKGLHDKEIAHELGLSVSTIHRHVAKHLQKD